MLPGEFQEVAFSRYLSENGYDHGLYSSGLTLNTLWLP
jgi:hypothetical protein